MRKTLFFLLATLFLIPTTDAQRGLLKGVLKNTENKIKYGAQRMLVDKASDALAGAILRRAERELDKVLRETYEKQEAEARERGETPKYRDYGGFLEAMNKAADVPAAYNFDLKLDCAIPSGKDEPQDIVYLFDQEGGVIAFESEAEGSKTLMVMDMDKDLIIMYQDNNGEKKATALPSMMSLGAAMARSEMEEVTGEMANLKATGKSRKIAGYNCNEYEYTYEKEKSLSYVSTDLDFNWPKAFGKMMDKFMPEKNSLPAEAFQGMALEAISYNKKGKEETRWTTNKVSKEKITLNNEEWNFQNFESTEK